MTVKTLVSALILTVSLSAHAGHPETGTGITSLDIYADGTRLHLLTGTTDARGKNRLWYQHSEDDGLHWSETVRVGRKLPAPMRLARGADARLAAHGNALVAVWTGQGNGFMGSGPLITARSENGGTTWTAGPNPADDGSTDGHAFTALSTGRDGSIDLAWLDTRAQKIQGLRHAVSYDSGRSWSPNVTVDPATCACCWNTMTRAAGDGSTYMLYRDHDPRDMALAVRRADAPAFERVGTVGAYNWRIDACPHVGGALSASADGQRLHALVWTGADHRLGLYHLSSHNRGRAWSKPRRIGGDTARYADVATHANGRVLAVWSEAHGEGSVIYGTETGKRPAVPRRLSAPDVKASHPRVVATARGFLVLWTEKTTADHAARIAVATW